MTRTLRERARLALLRAATYLPVLARSPDIQGSGHVSVSQARILLMRPDHLGDLLFTTPALRLLRQNHPDAHITALVGGWAAPALSRNPNLDQIITLPFPGFTREAKLFPWQPYTLSWYWARRLRGRYDVACVLRFDHWWGALLAYAAGIPYRIGYALPETTPFLTHPITYVPGRHEVEQNKRLVDQELISGAESPGKRPANSQDDPIEFHISAEATAWSRQILEQSHPIAIHPGAGAAIKLWRTERWAAVADALANETGATILLTGSKAERALCLEITGQMKANAQVMAGKTTLDQLAALFAHCRLVLGPDSGPLHLAVAVGTPTVHLYGPVDRRTFGPWGLPGRHHVLVSAWPCIPCNRLDYAPDELRNHPCVREISTGEVLDTAREALLQSQV